MGTRNGAVVSLSGGLDSTVTAAVAVKKFGKENVYGVGFDYGQKHRLELVQAELVAKYLGISFELIQLPRIFAGAGSTLVDEDKPVESVGSYQELSDRMGSQPTVVPNRNMVMLALGTTYALVKGVNYLMIGVHANDAANFHYPDCRPAFIGAMAAAIDLANEGRVNLVAPFNHITKQGIVTLGIEVGAPLHLTQSCYCGLRPQCGVCATCLERIDAFKGAGYIDPVQYEVNVDWGYCTRLDLPYNLYK